MTGPITSLVRQISLKRHRSDVPTGIVPLKDINSATVYIDSLADDAQAAVKAVQLFFESHSIRLTVFCPSKTDINCFGILKKRIRGSAKYPRKEDLFISLVASPDCFAAEYEARCSTAGFKVGRHQLSGKIFDMVVTPPEDCEVTQTAVFSAVKDFLNKIDR